MLDKKLEKRLESFQDVAGWKSIIFLPFSYIWSTLILLSILVCFFIVMSRLSYLKGVTEADYVVYVCDFLFLIDVTCLFMHYVLRDTRKLRIHKRTPILLLGVDFVSLIPIELIDMVSYGKQRSGRSDIYYYESLNRALRVYRVYKYFESNNLRNAEMQKYFFYTYVELTCYAFVLFHTGACVYQVFNVDEVNESCSASDFGCIMRLEAEVFTSMYQRFSSGDRIFNSLKRRILYSILVTIGYMYMNSYMLPRVIYSCFKRLRPFFEFWNRYNRLRIFIGNMTEHPELKRKILEEFKQVWTYGNGNKEPEILKSLPLSMRKNVYSDIFWDAFRHSELFRSMSASCKRSLALKFNADFFVPGTVFWEKSERRHCMIYLSSGILQVMAEENDNSPIMSFSSGTILGETTLFFANRSKAFLRVATFSEVHRLHAQDFFRTIMEYPADRRRIMRRLNFRLKVARTTQTRRTEILREMENLAQTSLEENEARGSDDAVKWVKNQFRAIANANDGAAAKKDGRSAAAAAAAAWPARLGSNIDHTSIYLPLVNLGEDVEVHTDLTCLKTSLPWIIDPHSSFIKLWDRCIIVMTLFICIIYPLFIGWWERLPDWLFNVSAFVSLMFAIDVFVQVSTAVKEKDVILVDFGRVVVHKMKFFSFYADLLAAIPLQIIFRYVIDGATAAQIRLSISICLVKVYKLALFADRLCTALHARISPRVMIKYLFFHSLIVYWSAVMIQVLTVECLVYECGSKNWYNSTWEENHPDYKYLASVFFALTLLLDIPGSHNYTMDETSFYIVMTSLAVVHYVIMAWYGDFNATYILEQSHIVKLDTLYQNLLEFMQERRTRGRTRKRVMETLSFQRRYDRGDLLTQERSMLDDAPEKLGDEIIRQTTGRVARQCPLFESEDVDRFVYEMCRVGKRIAVPAQSVLLTFGNQTANLYIVYKGYISINSYLPSDTVSGISPSLVRGPGTAVPVIIAMNQLPSAVTIRTVTDCELIVVGMENFVTILIVNDCLSYFVEAIKDVDTEPFESARLTLASIGVRSDRREDASFLRPFKKLKFVGAALRYVLLRRTIQCESRWLIRWEFFRLCSYMVGAVAWPIVTGLTKHRSRIYLIYGLLALESLTWLDFYVRMHVTYYDKRGISVGHSLRTVRHYLTSGFLLDFLMFVPYLHSIEILIFDPDYEVNFKILAWHSLLRMIGLKHLVQYFLYMEDKHDELINMRYIKYMIALIVFANYFVVLKIWSEIVVNVDADGSVTYEFANDSWIASIDIPDKEHMFKMYIIMVYALIMMLFRAYPFYREFQLAIMIWEIVLPCLGLVLTMYLHGFVSSHKMGANKNMAVFQYHMKSLAHFLNSQNADDVITREVISQFEHEWERVGGRRFQNHIRGLPEILQEDLLHPIYHKTFKGVPCFQKANPAFFRILSRSVTEVFMKKGTTILFEREAMNTIYFVHRGVCSVKSPHTILHQGSAIGDIRASGVMKSNIVALTHVVLLSVSSRRFFIILNNFYDTERAFFGAAREIDDFMVSRYVTNLQKLGDEDPWNKAAVEESECEFEMCDLPGKPTAAAQKNYTEASRKAAIVNFLRRKINPQSRFYKFLDLFFTLDVVATALYIPIVIGLRLRTVGALAIVYALDFVWFVNIAVSFRTMYVDRETGHLVSKATLIMRHYVKRIDGFFPDVLSILPVELVDILLENAYLEWPRSAFKYCFCLRLLRVAARWCTGSFDSSKLTISDWKKWTYIILKQIMWIEFFTAINLLIADNPDMALDDNQTEYSERLVDVYWWAYLSTLNIYTAMGIDLHNPTTLTLVIYYCLLVIISTFQRTSISNEVLFILSVKHHMKSEKYNKLELMDKFIHIRDASPPLRQRVLFYANILLESHKTEVMPLFLTQCPHYLKILIMEDLYVTHLSKCYAFQDLPRPFLMQLASRLQRELFLPSEVIVQKGDVDQNAYFVHEGEVALLDSDEVYPDLDYEVDIFTANDHFGLLQGLHTGIPHFSTFRAKTTVDILHLNYMEWMDLRNAFPEVTKIIRTRAMNLIGTVAKGRKSS